MAGEDLRHGVPTMPCLSRMGDAWMARRAIVPSGLRAATDQMKLSPAIESGDHVFLTGATGSEANGRMPDDPERQMKNAFDKIELVLRAGGLSCRSIVEMTTYHVGLRDHFDLFDRVRLEYLGEPYPAWTAVEVAGLRREGAIVEIRVIASSDPGS
jgi:enamine deaminase RidA (YjgF/YER057c/UK114 family)